MMNNIDTYLTKEEQESLSISEKTLAESTAMLCLIMETVRILHIKPGQQLLPTAAFKKSKSCKPYVKGFSYEIPGEDRDRMTDFGFEGQTYRLFLTLGNGQREAIPIFTPLYLNTAIKLLGNPRVSIDMLTGMSEKANVKLYLHHFLESIEVVGDERTKPDTMNELFFKCFAKSIILVGVDTSKVKCMSRLFYFCPEITNLDLSGLDTSNVQSVIQMFQGCSRLEKLDLSGWNLSRVQLYEDMFKHCQSLRDIRMKGCDKDSINLVKNALRKANLPENIIHTK